MYQNRKHLIKMYRSDSQQSLLLFPGCTRSIDSIATGIPEFITPSRYLTIFIWLLPCSLGDGQLNSTHGIGA